MTVFQLKQLASTSAHAAADAIRWNYDRAELIADGIVHGIGVFGGVIAATVLIVLAAVFASAYEIVTVSVYAAGLLAMLGFSAAYNLWPVSRRKWLLRRFDHSAIYVLIAATYTPIFAQLQDRVFRDVAFGRRVGRGGGRHCGEAGCCPAASTGSRSGFTSRWAGAASSPMTLAFPRCRSWRSGLFSPVACSTVSG